MQLNTSLAESLGRYLDLASDEMKVTAGNMANVDTPGYKTQGLDFAAEFQRSLGPLKRAGGSSDGLASGPRISDVEGLVSRPDGNNVSMDREALRLAKAQLEFRTGVELLKREHTRLMSAIHAEAR